MPPERLVAMILTILEFRPSSPVFISLLLLYMGTRMANKRWRSLMCTMPSIPGQRAVRRRDLEISRRLAARGHVVLLRMKWWRERRRIEREGFAFMAYASPGPFMSMKEIDWRGWPTLRRLLLTLKGGVVDCQNFPYLSCFSARLLNSWRRRNRALYHLA